MKKTEVRNHVVELLKPLINEYGFRYKSTSDGFTRKINEGIQYIGIPIYDGGNFFRFSLVFAIRLNVVENIIHDFLTQILKIDWQLTL